jgi:hypothetical protein
MDLVLIPVPQKNGSLDLVLENIMQVLVLISKLDLVLATWFEMSG